MQMHGRTVFFFSPSQNHKTQAKFSSSSSSSSLLFIPAQRMKVVLTTAFCGTDGDLERHRTWIEIFADNLAGRDITRSVPIQLLRTLRDAAEQQQREQQQRNGSVSSDGASSKATTFHDDDDKLDGEEKSAQLKMAFDGCGVAYGCRGVVFAHGLDEQTERTVERVKELLEANPKLAITVNALGLSRGGMALLILAQKFARQFSSARVELNLLLFDPVPGNLLTTAKCDMCRCSIANQNIDLRDAHCVKHILALYPHEPLPDVACHAPILPLFPSSANVEEDVTFGCHQGALFPQMGLQSWLTFHRLHDFLVEHGTQFNERELWERCSNVPRDRSTLLRMLEAALHDAKEPLTTRKAHNHRCCSTGLIWRGQAGGAVFVNKQHRQLLAMLDKEESKRRELQFLSTNHQIKPYLLDLNRHGGRPVCFIFWLVVIVVCVTLFPLLAFYGYI